MRASFPRVCISLSVTILIALIFGISSHAQQQPQSPPPATRAQAKPPSAASKGMTNTDVVNMVAAGLSEQIVIAAIRDAKARSFDLGPNGLIALKKAGVSDAVISVMMTPGAAPTPAPAAPAVGVIKGLPTAATAAPSGVVPRIVAQEPGLYYLGDQGIVRIEAKTPYQTRTGSIMVSRLTFGIKPARINAMLQGLRSDLQVVSAPRFYMHLGQILGQSESIGEYYLVKFTVKESGGRREIEIGSANFAKFQAGFPEKDLFQIDATRMDRDIYLVTPKSALGGGEYGILQLPQGSSPSPSPRKIFDFGVR